MQNLSQLQEQDLETRRIIRDETSRTCFVEAGAGSGKTTQLVARILTLIIEQGTPIEKIAAITFNTAASAELTSRLRRDLDNIERNGKLVADSAFKRRDFESVGDPELVSQRARQALQGLPGAAIETLHAFSFRLLKQFPLEAGLPPKVEKVDDIKATFDLVVRQESIIELLNQVSQGQADAMAEIEELDCGVTAQGLATALETLMENNIQFHSLSGVARWMEENWGELPPVSESVIFRAQQITALELKQLEDKLRQISADNEKLGAKFTTPQADSIAAHLAAGLEPKDWRPLDISPGNVGSKPLRDEAKGLISNFKLRLAEPVKEALTVIRRVMLALTARNTAQRCRSGLLEYHDMIFLARELLRDPANQQVSAMLHEQFRAIFVDEFQDTAPAQLEIVERITNAANGHTAPGHLFMVGDPKQSIYRFRNADVDTYMLARNAAKERGTDLYMSKNFRSSPAVIRGINLIFEKMFAQNLDTDGEVAPIQIPYTEMLPREVNNETPGRILLLRDESGNNELNPRASRAPLENMDIISLIRSAVSTKSEEQARAFFGTAKAFDISDIAILVPTHAVAQRIMSELAQENIPFVSEGSTALFAAPEISDLLTVLRALADPADSFASLSACRSQALGCSDKDIAQYAEAKLAGEKLPEDHPISVAQQWLQEKSRQLPVEPLGDAVAHIVAELNLWESVAAQGDLSGLERLRFVISTAREFGQHTGLGLRSFIRWTDEQLQENSGVNEPILDNDQPGVRIMTVHAAKGREFPFVILGGLANKYGNKKDQCGYTRANPRSFEFQIGEVGTPRFAEVERYGELAEHNERVRLHYVAATRAQDVLAIPLEIPQIKGGLFSRGKRGTEFLEIISRLNGAGHTGLGLMDRDELPGAETPISKPAGFKVEMDVEHVEADLARSASAVSTAAEIAPRVSVTRVAHAADTPEADDLNVAAIATGARLHSYLEQSSRSDTPGSETHGSTTPSLGNLDIMGGPDFGSAVHEVMERLPVAGGLSISELAATIAPLHGLEESAVPDIITAARSLEDSQPYRDSLQATQVYRELPIITQIDGTAVDGVIDLLYRDDQGDWVVADYKTDKSVTAATTQSYFLQLELYARVVEETLQEKVARLELIFVTPQAGRVETRMR